MSRLTTIIICLLLSVILGFLLLWPQIQKFSEARWQVKKQQVEYDNQEEYYKHNDALFKDLGNYQEQQAKIISALPSGPDVPALLNFLADAASGTGMSLGRITSFSTEQPKKNVKAASEKEQALTSRVRQLTIDFEVRGDYTNLKSFVSALEKSSRILEVDSISLKKKAAQPGTDNAPSFNFKITAYYY